ncbi:hypothetical protein STSP_69900 [Streptomyces jeddahensis]|uniref:Uncharacterized protein n=1 Tax=Streptomyces jeddahensis TaxID=1716141 RepID=A0A177HF47_9ACTN|nr:hypothetical protein STSP_69900 [Streptomyces jeddahensis]
MPGQDVDVGFALFGVRDAVDAPGGDRHFIERGCAQWGFGVVAHHVEEFLHQASAGSVDGVGEGAGESRSAGLW